MTHHVRSQLGSIARHLILWLCAIGDQAASKTQLHDTTEGDDVVERLIAMQLPWRLSAVMIQANPAATLCSACCAWLDTEEDSRTRQVDVRGAPCLARPAPPRPARPLPRLPSAEQHDGDAKVRRQRRFPAGAIAADYNWMTYNVYVYYRLHCRNEDFMRAYLVPYNDDILLVQYFLLITTLRIDLDERERTI